MVGVGEMHPIDKHRGPEAEAISGQLQGWEEKDPVIERTQCFILVGHAVLVSTCTTHASQGLLDNRSHGCQPAGVPLIR